MLITNMPRILSGPAAELNATNEKSKNENNRENAEANFTNPRRNYWYGPRAIVRSFPKNDEANPDSTVSNSLRSKLCFV